MIKILPEVAHRLPLVATELRLVRSFTRHPHAENQSSILAAGGAFLGA